MNVLEPKAVDDAAGFYLASLIFLSGCVGHWRSAAVSRGAVVCLSLTVVWLMHSGAHKGNLPPEEKAFLPPAGGVRWVGSLGLSWCPALPLSDYVWPLAFLGTNLGSQVDSGVFCGWPGVHHCLMPGASKLSEWRMRNFPTCFYSPKWTRLTLAFQQLPAIKHDNMQRYFGIYYFSWWLNAVLACSDCNHIPERGMAM